MGWLLEMIEGLVEGRWDEEIEEVLGELILIWIKEVVSEGI